jgi:hypothetical protein
MNTTGIITSSETNRISDSGVFYNAVCYRCHYVGMEPDITRCPLCQFAIILEPAEKAEQEVGVEEIFDRASVRLGAPPLPGLDPGKRKAQLLAEARRKRRTDKMAAINESDIDAVVRPRRATTVDKIVQSRTGVAVAFVSALVAGFAAAFFVNGGI